MAKNDIATWILIGMLFIFMFGDKLGILGAKPVDDGKPEFDGVCLHGTEGVTMTLGPVLKKWSPGTSIGTGDKYHRLWINGQDEGLKADGTTKTVSVKDAIELYYAENSSSYYAAKISFEVPCKSAFSTAEIDDDRHKLYELNAGWTFVILNEDGTTNPGTAEAIGAGDVDTLDITAKATYEDGFSPYGDVILACQWNSTAIDEVVPTGISYTSANAISATNFALNNTEYTAKFYTLPGKLDGRTLRELEFDLVIDADDSNDPVEDSIYCVLFDEDWYRNTDTGLMEFGSENNDNTVQGATDFGVVPNIS